MIWAKQLLDSNYALERVIGCGDSGIVVAARHARLGLRVALKFLRPDRPRTPEVAKRFVREGQINARIQNAHVTRVLDIGRLPDGEPFLVLEYLQGCDLAGLLNARGPLACADAVAYVRQACTGLASTHAHGVIHRDLRPANLFLTMAPNGSPLVKLLDFGFAEEPNQSQEDSVNPITLGSSPVVAPEQLRGERRADAKSDIWALGAALFTLLSGRSPFERSYASETYLAILSGRVPDLCALRADVERPLAAVVERCLAPNPEKRFASAAELGAALAPFSNNGMGTAARNTSRPPSITPPAPAPRRIPEPPSPDSDEPTRVSDLPVRNAGSPSKSRETRAPSHVSPHC
ncbi:MAG TPA: serine/threonine-protein kinase [Polyangiaceae bacterium]|nr:serine/threonine-protein kinase [Polyangiaceae bacterium]